MSESMEAKIKKLLHLAENAGTPGEAEGASKAAERLMLKWGIDEAVLRAKMGDDAKPEAIVVKYSEPFPKLYHKARLSVAYWTVLGMGNMKGWISGNRLAIMGYESDVDRALMFIPSILIQADHALATWWKSYPNRKTLSSAEGFRARRQFLMSFGTVVKMRLTEMNKEEVIVADREAEAGSKSTALVLLDRQAAVDAAYNDKMRGTRMGKARGLKGGDWDARGAGSAAGRNAHLGGKSIGGGSTKSIG